MPQQGALAAAAAAHDDERLASMDVKRDIIKYYAIAESPDEMINLNNCFSVGAHALKKKIPVNTAFITSIASKACTTEAVVARPTPSAPPSTFRPALHEIVIMIHAKTTLLIIPEYKSQVSELSSARNT